MKISLCLVICLLAIKATAGGIRNAYERMFVWYAYQAEIEYAREKHKTFSINNLQICPGKDGSGKDHTLTFGEFLELVAKVLAKCKKELGNNRKNIELASGALNRVDDWRKADYDLKRVPALKKDPNFKKIEWEFWTIELPGKDMDRNRKNVWNNHINWEATIDNAANSWYENISDIEKHVLDWERNTYFQGPEGARAKTHKNAIVEVQKAINISNNGPSC
ncbi:hypothetical protein V8C34DRAFT_303128 [Trichoderma compactum]